MPAAPPPINDPDFHRRIARAASLRELGDVRVELADRFGPPPAPVESLLTLQAIKIKAAELGAAAITYRGSRLQVDGLDLDDATAARLRAAEGRIIYFRQKRSLSAHRDDLEADLLGWVESMLDAIIDAGVSRDQPSTPGRVHL